jgi:NADH-quinone oxidoreductase subunit K
MILELKTEILLVSLFLFSIGCLGIGLAPNVFLLFICVELIIFAVQIIFILSSLSHDDGSGQIFALLTLTVAAAESAVGLAILVVCYRRHNSIEFSKQGILRH